MTVCVDRAARAEARRWEIETICRRTSVIERIIGLMQ
jgi:hypothetical protein